MIVRHAAAAGVATKLGNDGFRATGITGNLQNDSSLEEAAQMGTMPRRAPRS
jgi:hypothetical protein